MRFSLIKKYKAFQKNYMKVGVKKLLRAGMVPVRTWRVHAVGLDPTERLKLTRQMAAAQSKKSTTSLSLFMEAYGLEVEEELSTLATPNWAEEARIGKWHHEQKEAWMKQDREVQMWRQVRGPAGVVMCETRDPGIKWPQWHTLVFECDRRIDMRDMFAQKMLRKCFCSRLAGSCLAAQEDERRVDWKTSKRCEKNMSGRRLGAETTLRLWLVG